MDDKIKNFGRWCRERIVTELSETFKNNSSLFVTEFSGLKVIDVDGLRAKLRKNSSKLVVVKNSLAVKAFKQVNLESLSDLTSGQTGLVLGGDDPSSISKILVDFGKSFSGFQIKGGLFNGEAVTINQIKELSKLPPHNVMLAKVCSGIKAPLYRLVTNLGLLNRFILSLKRIEQIKKGGGQ